MSNLSNSKKKETAFSFRLKISTNLSTFHFTHLAFVWHGMSFNQSHMISKLNYKTYVITKTHELISFGITSFLCYGQHTRGMFRPFHAFVSRASWPNAERQSKYIFWPRAFMRKVLILALLLLLVFFVNFFLNFVVFRHDSSFYCLFWQESIDRMGNTLL